MKVITLQQLMDDFDKIMDDVGDNKQYYRIQSDQGDCILMPHDEFDVLRDTYQEWVEEPQIDPFPLPVEYVGDAEPGQLS
jgi:PHD/YefM family antitoxin component YafN of YafNO toxin-antitoxin module